MNVTSVNKLEKSQVELVIEADAGELEAAVQKAYQKQRKRISIPGFRKGRAPRKIIEAMYGSNVFYDSAINDIYPTLFEQAVKQEGLDPVAAPDVEIVGEPSKDGFSFKATVAVRPEVTLGEYKGLSAPKAAVTVTEADIDQELKPYVARATQLAEVEREAKKGDTVSIDYEGFIDGTAFSGGKEEGRDLELGSGSFIPGFEDQMEGAKAGEDRTVTVTFPEGYHAKELAGKEAVFQVKVHAVKEKIVPEMDDEFAKDVSEFETLADFREDLKKKLSERRELQAKNAFEEALLVKVTENMTADIPDAMVNSRAQQMLEDYTQRVAAQGFPLEQYMAMMGTTPDMLRQEALEGALRQVKMELAMDAIVKAEGLEASDEEVEEECKRLGEQYGMEVEKVKEFVSQEQVRSDILRRKAGDVIFAAATVEEPKEEDKEAEEEVKEEVKEAEEEVKEEIKEEAKEETEEEAKEEAVKAEEAEDAGK